MGVSFKIVRTGGLLLMAVITIVVGVISYVNSAKVIDNLSEVYLRKRPILEMAETIRADFLESRDILIAFTREEITDLSGAVTRMNRAIEHGFALRKMTAVADRERIDAFINAARRLKITLLTYFEEFQVDPTGSSALAMETLSIQTAKDASVSLQQMINDIKALIKVSDLSAYVIAKRSQQLITVVVVGGVLVGICAAFIVSRALVRPINQLVEATHHIAKGDLGYSIQPGSDDEMGQLARSFNEMALVLKKTLDREADSIAEAKVEAEKKRSDELARLSEQLKLDEQRLENVNKKLVENEAALKAKLADLEAYKKITIGRELKMIELKKEINELLTDLGRDAKYIEAEALNDTI